MKEPKLNHKEKIIEKLRPFWKNYYEKEKRFSKEVAALEKEMNKNVDLGVNLEFFHVDNECVGIGASKIEDRKKFPLIQDTELRKDDNV